MAIAQYKEVYALEPLRGTTVLHLGTGGGSTPDMPTVAVNSQRAATLSQIPAGTTATDYEYQFRPAPTISSAREADLSQTLAAGELPTDYEYQVR